MAVSQSRREVSGESSPAKALMPDFQPPELWDNKCNLLKPPSLWYLAMTALADKYSHTHRKQA